MNDVLIIITSSFPYQNGEEFLLYETSFYTVFKKVYIIPIAARDFSKEKKISKNIEVFQLKTVASGNRIIKLFGCASSLLRNDARQEVRYLKKTGRYNMASLGQALAASYRIASVRQEILEIIEKIHEHRDGNIILYSYWMGMHAKMATEVKEKYPDIKIITRCHGGDLYEYRYKTNYIPFRNVIFNGEDHIYTISEDGKKYLEQTYKELKTPITVSRLGTIQKYDRMPIMNKFGLNIVSCSYCIPLKRIYLIIEALSKVTKDGITWTHIGDGSEFEKLKALATEKLPTNVQFNFTGYVQNEKVQELYSTGKFNLFINVSETEGIPVSIMEAMSYGLPIIATDVGGVSEMVEEGINGFLLPKYFKPALLTCRILSMLEMSEHDYTIMSDNSHQVWKEKFNANKNYTEFVTALKEL